MLNLGYLAREAIDQLHHKASYFNSQEVVKLIAGLREMAALDWAKIAADKDFFTRRKTELLLSYGYDGTTATDKSFAFANGTAIIPIHGMLLNRFSGSYSFATGYNFIRSQRNAALADPDVKSIIYDVNSYGGLAAGCGELSKEMFDTRDVKPSMALVDHACYSAAYFLASAANKVVVTPSSGVGSIGCVVMHVDYSEMLDEEGIKVTFITSGKEKVDGNPFEPLSATAKKSIQKSVDYHAGAFFDAVVRNRGIEESDIRGFEARCFDPPDALTNGLIDDIQSPAEAVSSFTISDQGDSPMTTEKKDDGPKTVTMSEADLAKAIAAGIATHESGKRERKAAIMALPEAEGRAELANHLADNTDLSVDAIKGTLAVSPKKEAAKGGKNSPFHKAMDNTDNPGVGGDGDGDGGGAEKRSDEDEASSILNAYHAQTGNKVIPIKKSA